MSDLYLVLRSRLPKVAEWLTLGQKVMRDARKARGLSYESAARLLHVSSKTYERWEKAGRIPAHEIDRVAAVFGLEIERPRLGPITAVAERDEAQIAQAVDALADRLDARLDRIESRLDALQDATPAPRKRRAAKARP